MKVYIAKEDTWFDAGTKVKLIDDYRNDGYDFGLFEGLRGGKIDQETCTFDEFIIIDIEVLANKVVTETVRRILDNIYEILEDKLCLK